MKRNAVNSRIYLVVFAVIMILGVVVTVTAKPKITKRSFGKTADGKAIEIYTLTNTGGSEAKIITYGGAVVSLEVPDKPGKLSDVVLGYDSVAEYEKHTSFFGALIGRYGNRIGKAKFALNGKQFTLTANNGENHLHGGPKGYDRVVWAARPSIDPAGANLELTYLSHDGEEGYPGNLKIKVVYSLTEKNELKIVYSATSDKDTVVNLTHHSYFNLSGAGNSSILDHQLTLNADRFTPTDSGSIPTGELRSVKGTPFDFTRPTAIGARIDHADEQLKFGKGYDHNWVLNKRGNELSMAASVYEATSGRVMEVLTTEPGIQFYAGNFLDGSIRGKSGQNYPYRSGFCLEAQHFPDSPNKPQFPSTELKKGRTYSQTTIYRFSVR
jgi:aldose 1-epimerase